MFIFQPDFLFILPVITTGLFLAKRLLIDKMEMRLFKISTLLLFVHAFTLFQFFFGELVKEKYFFMIQMGAWGVAVGTLFSREFFHRFTVLENTKEERHKNNVRQKVPLLIGMITLTLQNTSGMEHVVMVFLFVMLAASVRECYMHRGKGESLTFLLGILILMLIQFLLSLPNIGYTWVWNLILVFTWMGISFFVDKIEYRFPVVNSN